MYKFRLTLALYMTRFALWLATPPTGTRYRFRIMPGTSRARRYILEYLNDLD